MKTKITLCTILSLILCFAFILPVSAIEADGSLSGSVITTVDGKDLINYPVSAEVKQVQDTKSAMAEVYYDYKIGKINEKDYASQLEKLGIGQDEINKLTKVSKFSIVPDSIPGETESKRLPIYQKTQEQNYYCGPATAQELLQYKKGTLYSQSSLASSLRCTSETPWYDGLGATGYPMADTLNAYINTSWYVPYGTSVTDSQFRYDVIMDIDNGYGVAGDALEVPGGPHLVGHPNTTIYHWFAIDGYYSYGANIWYMDSVAGCTKISWSSGVPAYSSMDYSTLARIVNGRGIIW